MYKYVTLIDLDRYSKIGNYTSTYCKDRNPGTCQALLEVIFNNDQNAFEALYCNTRKTHEINCLKTCRRCL